MTCLSSGPACNQIQPAAEVALWVLCSKGLVLIACLVGWLFIRPSDAVRPKVCWPEPSLDGASHRHHPITELSNLIVLVCFESVQIQLRGDATL